MTWESALTPTLDQTLNLIVSALANFFGTSTEVILTNAPTWLAKYGWYVTLHNQLAEWVVGGIFLGFLLVGGFLCLWFLNSEHEMTGSVIFVCIFLFVIGTGAIVSIPIITCMIAPEIVGLEAVIQLIK